MTPCAVPVAAVHRCVGVAPRAATFALLVTPLLHSVGIAGWHMRTFWLMQYGSTTHDAPHRTRGSGGTPPRPAYCMRHPIWRRPA